jgi:hypothetical protein
LHYINLGRFETHSDDLSVCKKENEEATEATVKSTEVDWSQPGLATWLGVPPAGSSFHAPNETTEAKRGVHPSRSVPATTRLFERRARALASTGHFTPPVPAHLLVGGDVEPDACRHETCAPFSSRGTADREARHQID